MNSNCKEGLCGQPSSPKTEGAGKKGVAGQQQVCSRKFLNIPGFSNPVSAQLLTESEHTSSYTQFQLQKVLLGSLCFLVQRLPLQCGHSLAFCFAFTPRETHAQRYWQSHGSVAPTGCLLLLLADLDCPVAAQGSWGSVFCSFWVLTP